MKKKMICVFLAALMLVGFLPAQALAASNLAASDDCIEMIKAMEGFSAKPYEDFGQYTVGYGTRCPDEDYERYMNEGISKEEAEQLLREYVSDSETRLNNFCDKYSLNLSQNQFDTLVMFSYNFGHAWLSEEGTFRSAVINGATGNEFLFAIAQWCKAGGQIRISGIQRRLKEANVYLNGVYSTAVPDQFGYVLYDANGGSCSVYVQGYDAVATADIVAVPTYDGFQFDGWYTAKTGGQKVTKLDSSTKSMTLYAHWLTKTGEELTPAEPDPSETTDPDYPTEAVNVQVKVTGTTVNVRKGPGTGYDIVTTVKAGTQLTITETAQGSGYVWGKFESGWICLKYTNFDDVQAEEEETEEESPRVIATGTVKLNSGSLRIRSSAGTSGTIVGYISNGTRVEIFERKTVGSSEWGRIEKGWISLDYVVLDRTEQDNSGTENGGTEIPDDPDVIATGTVVAKDGLRIRSGAGTNYSIVGKLADGTKVSLYEQKRVNDVLWGRIDKGWICLTYVKPDYIAPTVIATGTVVNTSKLRIRSAAGTDNPVVGNLNRGDRVEIYEKMTVGSMIWGRIEQGWISLDYVQLDGEEAPSGSISMTKTVTASSLRIRSGAGTSYSIVGYLTSGTKVTITETKTVGDMTWGRISQGWISMDYVK